MLVDLIVPIISNYLHLHLFLNEVLKIIRGEEAVDMVKKASEAIMLVLSQQQSDTISPFSFLFDNSQTKDEAEDVTIKIFLLFRISE